MWIWVGVQQKEQNLAYVEKENLYKKQEWMIGIEENTPYFECEECRNKYNTESKFFNPKPAHEYTIYYAVDKVTGEKKQLDI